jgi:hypothetical protein
LQCLVGSRWSYDSWLSLALSGQERSQQQIRGQQILPLSDRFSPQQWKAIGSFKIKMPVVSMATIQGIKGDEQTN